MSDTNSNNDRDGRRRPAEMTFEGQLALNEIGQTDPTAAALITAAWNHHNITD